MPRALFAQHGIPYRRVANALGCLCCVRASSPTHVSLFEAPVLSVPAVVSAACGCHGPESVVLDGKSGFVHPTGDVPALAQRFGPCWATKRCTRA